MIPTRADPETVRSLTRENESALVLARHGYDVEQNPEVSGPKRPDYRIEGNIFDNYAPITASADNIWSAMAKKVKKEQTSRVVLNLDDTTVTTEALRGARPPAPGGLQEVLVVRHDTVSRLHP